MSIRRAQTQDIPDILRLVYEICLQEHSGFMCRRLVETKKHAIVTIICLEELHNRIIFQEETLCHFILQLILKGAVERNALRKTEIESHILMAPDNAPNSAAISFFGKVTTIGALRKLQNDDKKMSKVASRMRDFMDDDAGLVLTDFETDCRKAAFDELIDELLP